jgi:Ca2+-binding EF-hand superfamily protein
MLIATAFQYKGSSKEKEAHIERIFHAFDVDDDQKINKSELQKYFDVLIELTGNREDQSSPNTRLQVDDLFKKYDKDLSGFLDKEEFVKLFNEEEIIFANPFAY